jgi:hypothetical protein
MTYAKNIAEWGHYPPVNNNILINPSFTVQQRGDVIDHNIASYGPDRWSFRGLDSVKGTMVQSSTDSTTGTNKLVVKHRNATSFAYVYQSIEAVNVLGLYGKEMTFSFSYSDTGGSGKPLALVRSWDSSDISKALFDGVPTSLGDNRWTCTFTLTTADGTVPDPNETGMQVLIYPNEKNAAPAEWSVWETKLEAGSVATPFVARSYGEELALCYRYYQDQSNPDTYRPFIWTGVTNGSNHSHYGSLLLPVAMRATPTVTVFNENLKFFGNVSAQALPNAVRFWAISSEANSRALFECDFTAEAEL